MVSIQINGQYLDLGKAAIRIENNNFGFELLKGVYSQEFDLPLTAKNRGIIGAPDDERQATTARAFQCRVLLDGVLWQTATLKILRGDTDNRGHAVAKVRIDVDVNEFVGAVRDQTLRNLDLGTKTLSQLPFDIFGYFAKLPPTTLKGDQLDPNLPLSAQIIYAPYSGDYFADNWLGTVIVAEITDPPESIIVYPPRTAVLFFNGDFKEMLEQLDGAPVNQSPDDIPLLDIIDAAYIGQDYVVFIHDNATLGSLKFTIKTNLTSTLDDGTPGPVFNFEFPVYFGKETRSNQTIISTHTFDFVTPTIHNLNFYDGNNPNYSGSINNYFLAKTSNFNNYVPNFLSGNTNALVPMLRLRYIFNRIATFTGYTFVGDFFAAVWYENLILYNTYPVELYLGITDIYNTHVDWKNHVPDVSIGQFLTEIARMFCLGISIRQTSKTVEMFFNKSLLDNSIPFVDWSAKEVRRKGIGVADTKNQVLKYADELNYFADDGSRFFAEVVESGGFADRDENVLQVGTLAYELGNGVTDGFKPARDEQKGNSVNPQYEIGNQNPIPFRVLLWQGLQDDGTGKLVPTASAVDVDGNAPIALTIDGAKGLAASVWVEWLRYKLNRRAADKAFLLTAIDYTTLDPKTVIYARGARYIQENLSLEISNEKRNNFPMEVKGKVWVVI